MEQKQINSSLVEHIRQQILQSADQMISFQQYMELCLYAPNFGYYTGTRTKVGKKGDFYTSSAIGGILGEMLACFIAGKMAEAVEKTDCSFEIVEWGGGTGQLAKQILDKMRADYPAEYGIIQYYMIERSEFHRQQQQEMLIEHQSRISFTTQDAWMKAGSRKETFIFSNELLDSFPVHRVRCHDGQLYEIHVYWDSTADAFQECEKECCSELLVKYIEEESIVLRDGQTAEINLAAEHWIREVSEWLEQGDIMTIDYGDVAEEIYSDHRFNGTLLCYRNHRAYDNPYIYAGEQDITSHVNFSSCIKAGTSAGIQQWKLQTQREFLVEAGVLEQLSNDDSRDPFSAVAKKNRAIRQILLSDQMSELFKVLLQTKLL